MAAYLISFPGWPWLCPKAAGVKRHPVSRDKATATFTHPGRRLQGQGR